MTHARLDQSRSHHLPPRPTPLLGREAELAAVRGLLLEAGPRLVTLAGPPGTGKTRLAVEVASTLLGAFAHGAWFVDLAPISDPVLVVPAIAAALGVPAGEQPPRERLRAHLPGRQLLLVLDNFEQVLEAAPEVGELLGACPELRVLATSREPLRLRWEQVFPVPELGLPDLEALPEPALLAEVSSVALFVARARAIQPRFELNEENAPAVAELCVRLDGLPLAIELAAARIDVLPPTALLARLGQRLDLLVSSGRDQPARHRTLRAAIAWSYDLLDPAEQRLFRCLGAFVGGCTLEALEAVCGDGGTARQGSASRGPLSRCPAVPLSVLAGLASLIGKSLVRPAGSDEAAPRYFMLETIREYAAEQLAASDELEAVRGRHAAFFLERAEAIEVEAINSHRVGRVEGLAWLGPEQDNLRAALRWAIDRGAAETALRLGAALTPFWDQHGDVGEGRRWLNEALALAGETAPAMRAAALEAAAYLATRGTELIAATELLEEVLALRRQLGDQRGALACLLSLGMVLREAADPSSFDRAMVCYEEALALAQELGDAASRVGSLQGLAYLKVCLGDYSEARRLLEESLALAREVGDPSAVFLSLSGLLSTALGQDEDREAETLAQQLLALAQELGQRFVVLYVVSVQAILADRRGEHEQAAALLRDCLVAYQQAGARNKALGLLEAAAGPLLARGQPHAAARLLGTSQAGLEALGVRRVAYRSTISARSVAAARAALGEVAFAAAYAEGSALSLEQAVEEALGLLEPQPEAPPDGTVAAPASGPILAERPTDGPAVDLTPREREIAALIARGLTNHQIADELVLSVRTVERHVENLYQKLGVSGRAARAAVAAFAAREGLAAPR